MKNKPIVLAFDLRDARSFCLVPASVDINAWEQVDDKVFSGIVEKISKISCRPVEGLRLLLNGSFVTCIPFDWIVSGSGVGDDVCLVAFCSQYLGDSRKSSRKDLIDDEIYGCKIERQDLIDAGWVSLGFDLCDDVLGMSLLYTDDEFGAFSQAKERGGLNSFGLFDSCSAAIGFLDLCQDLYLEHQPFSPVEVLIEKIPGVIKK